LGALQAPGQTRSSAVAAFPAQWTSRLEDIAAFAAAVGPGASGVMPQRLSPDPDSSWLSRPFVHVRIVAGMTVVRGMRAWFGGHVLRLAPDGTTDGIFGAWCADEDGVEVRNDRYGCHPLYYFSNEQEFAVSPFVLTLLACGAPRDLDEEGLAVFLRTGFFIGEHTPFRQIHALPPDCRLRWSRGSLRISGGMLNATHRVIPRTAAIDAFIDLFAQAIRRRAGSPGRLILPLSGGRDSRHIFLELLRQGHIPDHCITAHQFPPTPDHDAAIASEVARAAGVRHVTVRQPAFPIRDELAKNLWLGLCTEEHAQFLPVMRTIASQPAVRAFDGIGGDVLTGDWLKREDRLALFLGGRLEELAGTYLRDDREVALKAMLPSGTYGRLNHGLAHDALLGELRRHAHQPNPVGSFMFWNRTRRILPLVSYGLYMGAATVFAPYLDRDVFDFLTSLPGAMLEDRQFHNDAIRRAYPRYASIPFSMELSQARRVDRWFNRRFVAGIMMQLAVGRRPSFVRRSYLLPRLAKPLWNGTSGYRRFPPYLILYLLQLGRIVAGEKWLAESGTAHQSRHGSPQP